MLKMFRVSRIQHVSTNDWQDGVTCGKDLKQAKKNWSVSWSCRGGKKRADWIFEEFELAQ
jgi:hypothetical protein